MENQSGQHAVCNINLTTKIVQTNLKADYRVSWKNELHNDVRAHCTDKNKLRTYRQFKTGFSFEDYLTHIKNKNCRKLVTKLRISDHNLQIELGRRSVPKIPSDERFCNFCKNVEDEFHYIIRCSKYVQYRNVLFTSMELHFQNFVHLSDREKFLFIMSFEDKIPLVRYISNTTKSPPAAAPPNYICNS